MYDVLGMVGSKAIRGYGYVFWRLTLLHFGISMSASVCPFKRGRFVELLIMWPAHVKLRCWLCSAHMS